MLNINHTQNKRSIRIYTHLGDNVLMASSALLSEEMSKPFFYEVDVYSERSDLDAEDLVGTKATLEVIGQDNLQVRRNGYVTSFACLGTDPLGDKTHYTITIEPWLALLADTYNCRIYQNKDVKAVIKDLFSILSNDDKCDDKLLKATYKTREYWVQHNETIKDYFHRICRLEGIAYFFEHTDQTHTLKLVDSALLLPKETSGKPLKLQTSNQNHECLTNWRFVKRFVVGKTIQRSYNYKTPAVKLESKAATEAEIEKVPRIGQFESYKYSESFDSLSEGNAETQRLNHQQAASRHGHWQGMGDYRHLVVGQRFTLTKVPVDLTFKDLNTTFNLTKLNVDIDEERGHNHIEIEATANNALVFPVGGSQKRMMGVETAVVTGPKGAEIHTNEHGQIKVQFHWDREGKGDQNTSCWLRVMNNLAGPGFGSQYTPRIGQEVVVAFENGNPDKPFVLGALYHHEHIPPFVKDKGFRAGIRTHSTLKGGSQNYNELSFYDKKGKEEVFLQAEKDFNLNIKNNETSKVAKDKAHQVGNNETQKVGKNLTVDVGDTMTFKAGKKIKLQVGGSTITITGSKIDISSSLVDVNGGKINLN